MQGISLICNSFCLELSVLCNLKLKMISKYVHCYQRNQLHWQIFIYYFIYYNLCEQTFNIFVINVFSCTTNLLPIIFSANNIMLYCYAQRRNSKLLGLSRDIPNHQCCTRRIFNLTYFCLEYSVLSVI